MPFRYSSHGGGCCGYYHLWGFDNATVAELDDHIATHRQQANRVLEAILTDRQLVPGTANYRVPQEIQDLGGWATILRERGFYLNLIWQNSNTGRTCYQFLNIPTPMRLEVSRLGTTAGWDGEGPVIYHQPAVRNVQRDQPRNVVMTHIRGIFQGDRVGERTFADVESFSRAFPRATRYQREVFYNDGTIETVQHEVRVQR